MIVTVSKSGTKDRLLVDLIDIYLVSPDKKIKGTLERFQCKKYDLGGSKLPTETKKCQTGPYHYQKIEKAIFQMGEFYRPTGSEWCAILRSVRNQDRAMHLVRVLWRPRGTVYLKSRWTRGSRNRPGILSGTGSLACSDLFHLLEQTGATR